MRVAYVQCANGASGDMILGALVDAGVPLRTLQDALDTLGPLAPRLEVSEVRRAGLRALHVQVHGPEGADHGHMPLSRLTTAVATAPLEPHVREDSLAVLRALGEAEATVHGIPPDQDVLLEELGSVDTLADVVGVAAGLAFLGVERVHASALPLGGGQVRTHHGVLPVPAPGVLELVRRANAPVLAPSPTAPPPGELVTPTGAALLTTLATFRTLPPMTIDRVGYGAGTRDPDERPNVLVLWVGETQSQPTEDLLLIETTIDDMQPQAYGYLRERLMAEGALDVWLTPVQMKKDRPGIIVSAVARPAAEARLTEVLLQESSTLGVRIVPVRRHEAEREVTPVETPLGMVRVKIKRLGGRPISVAPEYDDCRRLAQATGMSLQTVLRIVQRAADDCFLSAEE